MSSLGDAVQMAVRLRATGTDRGRLLASKLVADTLRLVAIPNAFLPLLDAFLEAGAEPADVDAVVDAARALGVPEDAVIERLDRSIDQLERLIAGNVDDLARYRRLALRIEHIPPELLEALARRTVETGNLSGMAALLAIALGDAAALAPADFVAQAFGHKGIGGGTNLLKQWFEGRDRLESSLRQKVKHLARNALVELGIEWAAKGGRTGVGLVPQTEVRPFTGADDLDRLDIESTLDALVASGKPLDRITEEDLWVYRTAKGRAVIGVLIDISGSMGGKELAVCAIAVIMLLARLTPEEVAIALFESDTHVVKGFGSARDLDEVADELLELRATGGTRVDRALEWIAGELEQVEGAEFRLLFLLSDFCFFEQPKELLEHAHRLAALGTRWLGASHGRVCKGCGELLRDTLRGMTVKLDDLAALPAILHQAIVQVGDRGTF